MRRLPATRAEASKFGLLIGTNFEQVIEILTPAPCSVRVPVPGDILGKSRILYRQFDLVGRTSGQQFYEIGAGYLYTERPADQVEKSSYEPVPYL